MEDFIAITDSHAKIFDDSKQTIHECVSVFISFITLEANDRFQSDRCKTITPEDILWAMSKVDFKNYIEPLTLYLHQYRKFDGGESESLRGEPLLLKHQLAHHHGYFVSPPLMGNNNMQGDALNGSTLLSVQWLQWIETLSLLRRRVRSDQFLC